MPFNLIAVHASFLNSMREQIKLSLSEIAQFRTHCIEMICLYYPWIYKGDQKGIMLLLVF